LSAKEKTTTLLIACNSGVAKPSGFKVQAIHHSLFTDSQIHHSPFTHSPIHHSLFTIHHSPFTIHRVKKEENTLKVANFQKVGNLEKPATSPYKLSKENGEAMQEFKRQLVLKGYSQSTLRTYENEFRQFLQTLKDKPATGFTVSRLKDYFQYCKIYKGDTGSL
jgi:hypothetical protein